MLRNSAPERCPFYLAWIRTLPCAICLRLRSSFLLVEAAHTKTFGPRGLGQKTSDYSAIPLCFWHHRGNRDSYHQLGEARFAERHGIDLRELVLTLNELYRSIAVILDENGVGEDGPWLRTGNG